MGDVRIDIPNGDSKTLCTHLTSYTIRIDKVEGEYDLHDEYSMTEDRLVLKGLDDGGDDEMTELLYRPSKSSGSVLFELR